MVTKCARLKIFLHVNLANTRPHRTRGLSCSERCFEGILINPCVEAQSGPFETLFSTLFSKFHLLRLECGAKLSLSVFDDQKMLK